MNNELELKLILCLDALDTGEPITQILARYPHDAAVLRPMLETAGALPSLAFIPSSGAQITSRRAFLNRAADMRPAAGRRFLGLPLRMGLTLATVLLALVIAGGGTVAASSAALPGEPLYGVKRAAEHVQVVFASDKAPVEREIAQRRRDEIGSLMTKKRSADVEFSGIVTSFSGSTVQIAKFSVQVDANTRIDGALSVGAMVTITGRVDGETIRATRIAVEIGGTPVPSAMPTFMAKATLTATATLVPTSTRTAEPTLTGTLEPMDVITALSTAEPIATRTARPQPVDQPTPLPTLAPRPTAVRPTAVPTESHGDGHSPAVPTEGHSPAVPTEGHGDAPTARPTARPTNAPTARPTARPTDDHPSEATARPTAAPTARPTARPTDDHPSEATARPTNAPTARPTARPTDDHHSESTARPTDAPAAKPTNDHPSESTARPADAPTARPTDDHHSESTSTDAHSVHTNK